MFTRSSQRLVTTHIITMTKKITSNKSFNLHSPFTRKKYSFTTITTETQPKVKEKIDPALYGTRDHPTDVSMPKLGPLRSYKTHLDKGQRVLWCTCGHSKTAPFCDGTHKTIIDPITKEQRFKPIIFEATESKMYGFCMCKYSRDPVICDGYHKTFKGWQKPPQPYPANPPPPPFDSSLI